MALTIKKGDKVRITGPYRRQATVIEGTVISADNNGSDASPNWYIEIVPTNLPGASYLYWKQGEAGGTVEKL